MAAERLQCFVIFISGILLTLSNSEDFTKCWFGAPTVNDATINTDISATRLPDSPQRWDIRATVTWDRPQGFNPEFDTYVVSIRRIEADSVPEDEDLCVISDDERTVDFEAVTFANLSFGFLHEFKLYTYNTLTSKKTFTPITTAFITPDCYQATSDPEFCSTIDVQYSGAPLEPLLDSICFNDTSQFIEVTVSWLPPIQVNGDLEFFNLQVILASEEFDSGENALHGGFPPSSEPPSDFSASFGPPTGGQQMNIPLPLGYQEGERIEARLSSLDRNEYYILTITPVVLSGDDQGIHPGIEVEMSFFTDAVNYTESIPLCGEDDLFITPTRDPSTKKTAAIHVTTRTTTVAKLKETTSVPRGSFTPTKKTNSETPVKIKEENTKGSDKRSGPGTFTENMIEPITPVGVVIVVLATIVVTVLVITTLVVGVHYMRGVAPETPTKMGTVTASGSSRINGVTAEENGTPLTEDV